MFVLRQRLASPSVPFWVDISFGNFGGRWLAVAEIADEKEIGLGSSARQAASQALASLGKRLALELAADVRLPDSWPT